MNIIKLTELLTEIRSKANMEKVIEGLYDLNYRFVSTNWLESEAEIGWKKKEHKLNQHLIRLDHIDKDPLNDIYNFNLIFGIRFFDKRMPDIQVYYEHVWIETIPKEWARKATQNMQKKKIPLTFPEIMSIQDRIDWRKYHEKWRKGSYLSQEEQIYYFRFKPHIGNLSKEDQHLS